MKQMIGSNVEEELYVAGYNVGVDVVTEHRPEIPMVSALFASLHRWKLRRTFRLQTQSNGHSWLTYILVGAAAFCILGFLALAFLFYEGKQFLFYFLGIKIVINFFIISSCDNRQCENRQMKREMVWW